MKRIIIFCVLLAACTSAYSQYFIVKVGGGYLWPGLQNSNGVLTFQPGTSPDPANSVIMPLFSYNTAAADSNSKYKSNVYAGYGTGGHFDFAFGYMFNPYFGIQLDGAYLWGSTIQASQTFDDPLLGNSANIITKTHADGLTLNPSLVFRAAKATSKVAPYARVGLALPVQGAIYHTLNITAPNSILGDLASSTIDIKTTQSVSVGFQGAAGVSYTPIPLISIWGELYGQDLFLRGKEASVTEYVLNFNGSLGTQNMLSTDNALNGGKPYDTYSANTVFVDELTTGSNTQQFGKQRDVTGAHNGQADYVNESQPQDQLRQVANMTAFGFTVGVNINMSKQIFKDPLGKKAKAAANQ